MKHIIQIEYHFVLLMVECKYYKAEEETNSPSYIDIEEIRVIDSEYDISQFFTYEQLYDIKETTIKVIEEYYI